MNEAPVTLITGTRTGIGKNLAQHFLRCGHYVVGCSRKEPEWEHERYAHHMADVSDERAVSEIFHSIRKQFGRLDHLINNAGVASMNHSLLTPLTTVRRVLETNVVGAFLFSREAAKLMRVRKYGRIVNLATVAVPLKLEGEAIYVASKAAVLGMTDVMARELAVFGVTVNAVGPGPIKTDLISGVPREKIESLLTRQAIARYTSIDDVINVIDFYFKKESGMITGQCLYLGGV